MARPAKGVKDILLYTLLAVLILSVIGFIVYVYTTQTRKEQCPPNRVCLTTQEYQKLSSPPPPPSQPPTATLAPTPTRSHSLPRDYRVVNDPLFPPLNRTDASNHVSLEANIRNRNMYVPTNDIGDSFRLVGYLTASDLTNTMDAGGNNWKLFAREKDRHTSEFYMVPTNNNYDIKIFVTPDIVKGERLRDVYTIPNQVSFNSPMLLDTPYKYVEIPKADLASSTRYM